jgi:hypothetical protein
VAMVLTLGYGHGGAQPSRVLGDGRLILSHGGILAGLSPGSRRDLILWRKLWALPPATAKGVTGLALLQLSARGGGGVLPDGTWAGTPRPAAMLLAVYPQISGTGCRGRVTVCKTVGLAYVGSNPTPATQKPRSEPLTRTCVSGSNAENKRFGRPLAGVVGHTWARSGRSSSPLVMPAAGRQDVL